MLFGDKYCSTVLPQKPQNSTNQNSISLRENKILHNGLCNDSTIRTVLTRDCRVTVFCASDNKECNFNFLDS